MDETYTMNHLIDVQDFGMGDTLASVNGQSPISIPTTGQRVEEINRITSRMLAPEVNCCADGHI